MQNLDVMLVVDIFVSLQNKRFHHGWRHDDAWLPLFIRYGKESLRVILTQGYKFSLRWHVLIFSGKVFVI